MSSLNPKEELKKISKEYPSDQRGYSYLSHYAQTIKYLMTKWKESEADSINKLYSLELKLDDFIEDSLDELQRVQENNIMKSREVLNKTHRELMEIKGEFLNMFNEYYQNTSPK